MLITFGKFERTGWKHECKNSIQNITLARSTLWMITLWSHLKCNIGILLPFDLVPRFPAYTRVRRKQKLEYGMFSVILPSGVIRSWYSLQVLPVLNSTLFSKFKDIYISAVKIHNNQEKIPIASSLVHLRKEDRTANQSYICAKWCHFKYASYPYCAQSLIIARL